MSIRKFEEMLHLLHKGTESGKVVWNANFDQTMATALVGQDVFELHRIEADALEIRHQNIDLLLLPETEEWYYFNSVLAASLENDDAVYASRRAVLSAVTARLHAILGD